MSNLPDFEGLALFAKVVEERSFAAAARSAGVSVATVSRGIERLEARLGARLFNRSSRRLALTDFGQGMADRALRLYAEAEAAENAAREMSSLPRGIIRLAAPMSFGVRWLAPVLPDFLAQYPDISIDMHLSDAIVDLVGDGFDAAVRLAALPESSLVARRLAKVAPFLVASPAYLARHGRPDHPRELDPTHCLGYAYRPRQDVWHFRNAEGAEESVTPSGRLRVTNVDALLPVLLAGLGVAELPEFLAAEYLADGRLVAILTDWTLPTGAMYFVTPSARARPAKVTVLSDFLATRFSHPAWIGPR